MLQTVRAALLISLLFANLIACTQDAPTTRHPSTSHGDAAMGDPASPDDGALGDLDVGDPANLGDGGDTLPGDIENPSDAGADSDQPTDADQGDSGGGDNNIPLEDCGRTWPVPETGTCSVQSGNNAHLLIRGDIVLPNGILAAGELLTVDGTITCTGCDCSQAANYSDATILTCGKGIVSPGLINAHDHITFTQMSPADHGTERYNHRHEWRKGLNGKTKIPATSVGASTRWGEARQVMAGTTSLFGSGGGQGFLRNLDMTGANLVELSSHKNAQYNTFPLDDSDGTMATSGCSAYGVIDKPADVIGYAAYVPHVGEGIGLEARNEFLCTSGASAGSQDLVFGTSAFIHGIGFTAADIGLMAVESTGLIWSPRSNTDLYGMTADAPLYNRMGATVALGTDWTASGSMNLLRELKCADTWNNSYWNGYFSDADLVAMVTHWSAELMGFEDVLGSLLPGRVADITIWDASTHPGYRAILDAGVSDVALVLRSGTPLYGDTALMTHLAATLGDCESPGDVCGISKLICAKQETGSTLAALAAAAGTPYGLFFCGTPTGEPSCVPFRPGEFDGLPNPDGSDEDGDGVPDTNDNCVGVFNPGMPLYDNLQPDSDGDDLGDACDPCPLAPNTTTCPTIDPNDRDGDGVPNTSDNCPSDANPLQADADGDNKGDVCDSCPNDSNPGSAACPASIYDIKQRITPLGETVAVLNAVVTAKSTSAFFMQVDPSDAAYQGAAFSGIYVYTNSAPTVAVGNVVTVTGKIVDFHGGLELDNVTVTKVADGPVNIPATLVMPADVAPSGSQEAAYEGVLVQVQDITVLDITPPAQVGETVTNEFLGTGNISVDDGLYVITPTPVEGQVYSTITGVLRYTWNRNKLWPRTAADVTTGAPVLITLAPATAFLALGATDAATTPKLFVTLSSPAQGDTFIAVTSEYPAMVSVKGGGVTIPAGQTTGEVLLSGLSLVADLQLTATLGSALLTSLVTVWDPAEPAVPVSLTPAATSVLVDATQTFTVTLNHPAPLGGQEVDLTYAGDALATAPSLVTVPEGALTGSFDVTAGATAGSSTVTATVGTTSVSATLTVTASNPVGLLLAEVFYDPSAVADTDHEWIKIYNGTGSAVDLAGYSLAWGGSAYGAGCSGLTSPTCVLQLTGTVQPGQCFLVGGPNSVAGNFLPSFNQAVDLNPDLENSGSGQADAVGLFHMVATSIVATSLPVDVVLYGTVNDKGFKGPDGNPSPVHVADAPGGSSIKRTGVATWAINATPMPNACDPIQ